MFPYITHPSATRRIATTVQLACFRPAASVRSEPGSNSHFYFFFWVRPAHLLKLLYTYYNKLLITRTLQKLYHKLSQVYSVFIVPCTWHPSYLFANSCPCIYFSSLFTIFFNIVTNSVFRFFSAPFRFGRWEYIRAFHKCQHLFSLFLIFFHLFLECIDFYRFFIFIFFAFYNISYKNMLKPTFFSFLSKQTFYQKSPFIRFRQYNLPFSASFRLLNPFLSLMPFYIALLFHPFYLKHYIYLLDA